MFESRNLREIAAHLTNDLDLPVAEIPDHDLPGGIFLMVGAAQITIAYNVDEEGEDAVLYVVSPNGTERKIEPKGLGGSRERDNAVVSALLKAMLEDAAE